MNRDQKSAVIDAIAADITSSQAIFAVDYRGITVAQAEALRQRLREADASFRVVKNSLTERAADRAGAEQLKALLEGPTALTFVRGDAAAAAKAVADFARATQVLAFKGGVMNGAALTAADVGAISRLPSRDALYGQLVGLVASPIAGLARTLNAIVGGLAIALNEVLAKKESGEIAAATSPLVDADSEGGSAEGSGADADEVGDSAAFTGATAEQVVDSPQVPVAAETVTEPPVVEPVEMVDSPEAGEAFGGEPEPAAAQAFAVGEEPSTDETSEVSAPEASGDDEQEA